jgi:diguanylate cyclase (GGDEF)-like protein
MTDLRPFGWIAPEMMSGAAGRLERILHEGQLGFASAVARKDGSVIPTDVVTRRLDTDRGPLLVTVLRDVSERLETQRELEFLAYHDALTGLWNRAAFEERLRVTIADTRRHGDVLGLAYIDLDRFKPVNDQFGHQMGDAVLIALGSRMVASVREQDMVVRLGGDEFVILLPRMASADEFEQLAERLLEAIHQPITVGDNTCSVTATIGFALFDHEHDDARSLLVKSDIAMYRAKRDDAHPWLEWVPDMGVSFS